MTFQDLIARSPQQAAQMLRGGPGIPAGGGTVAGTEYRPANIAPVPAGGSGGGGDGMNQLMMEIGKKLPGMFAASSGAGIPTAQLAPVGDAPLTQAQLAPVGNAQGSMGNLGSFGSFYNRTMGIR